MNETPGYALLGSIDDPAAIRALPADQLPQLAHEIRRCLIETLARVGGHFAASLGVVELTLALHRVFDTPRDALVWDIGHQAYAHKIVTGRRARLETIRKHGGLAPFLDRGESAYDAFGGGHAGTAISAAAGFAAAEKLRAQGRRSIAVIGDGGFTAGMAFEAMNHAGHLGLDLLVVFNDNDLSISENVGALRDTVARQLGRALPSTGDGSLAALVAALGFSYSGPVDGHDLDVLLPALERLKAVRGPQFLHVVTIKGRGYAPAEADPIAFHGVTRFDPVTGALPAPAAKSTYSDVFGDWLIEAASADPAVVAITPAMREGSGLVKFAQTFPDRYFDAGIAEQHAVTLAAGMACAGLKPVVAIYSTFLQRALDQLIHDVATQRLPVLFAIDRGGLVGADGATHHGAFDLSLLRAIPNLLLMAPSDEQECRQMLATGLAHDGPSAVRYPRGHGPGAAIEPAEPLPIGRGRVLRRSANRRPVSVALIGVGSLVATAMEAAALLDATVADLRFVKPLDEALLAELARDHALLVTLEDNVVAGGVGSAVNEWLAANRATCAVLNLGLPDRFVGHGSREQLLADCGLDAAGVLRAIQNRLRSLSSSPANAGFVALMPPTVGRD
ncbi:1-deoxy-D-xylulose-5-phosphate synthase [Nevskia sp.]|uniref:1-deoxy-D-xylulose-5-phosphate synthase n=1 Tax=Nevskia sp. TaxID=1929292 RepID=UPI0025CDFF60|nr:1-deoxy-D-xylulose-5-phosphate synthase [Nevskia sp.]